MALFLSSLYFIGQCLSHVSCCCDKISSQSNLRKKEFILLIVQRVPSVGGRSGRQMLTASPVDRMMNAGVQPAFFFESVWDLCPWDA